MTPGLIGLGKRFLESYQWDFVFEVKVTPTGIWLDVLPWLIRLRSKLYIFKDPTSDTNIFFFTSRLYYVLKVIVKIAKSEKNSKLQPVTLTTLFLRSR